MVMPSGFELRGVASYGLQEASASIADVLSPGPVPLLEAAEGGGSDERTDRGRAFPPHIADLIVERRCHGRAQQLSPGPTKRLWELGLQVDWLERISFASDE